MVIESDGASGCQYPHSRSQRNGNNNGGICSVGEYEFPADPSWELDRSKLVIKDSIGEGEFGRVVLAEYNGVAANGNSSSPMRGLSNNSTINKNGKDLWNSASSGRIGIIINYLACAKRFRRRKPLHHCVCTW